MQGKVLICEDNVDLSDLLRNYLIRDGHTVYQAYNGKQAVDMARNNHPDIMLLDIMMPLADGYEVCKEVRSFSKIPIIVTSAKVTEEDKEKMFTLGVDDYLTKPFSLKEAVLRVNAQLRRCFEFGTVSHENKREFDNLLIFPDRFEAVVDGKTLTLSNKEFKLLDTLTAEPDRIFEKGQLLDKIWGFDDYIDENTLAVTVARLRDKLTAHGVNRIVTVWGIGYKWKS